MYEYEKGEASKFAQRVASAFARGFGAAALLVAVGTLPAEAKKKPKPIEKSSEAISDPANGEPLTLIVSLGDQEIDVYRGLTRITSSKVSTGTRAYPTNAGVFSILEKRRHHHSNMYSAAPMPWMQRLTWSGTALHGGVVPGYPASHGCIRLSFSFAPKLFQITMGGENVIVASKRPVPSLVDHPTLFQPARISDEQEEKESIRANNARTLLTREGPSRTSETSAQFMPGQPDTAAEMAASGMSLERTKGHSIDNGGSLAPLRILVTRRTERDRLISVQHLLASMGYLTPQKFSGRLGKATVTAIKAFQKANGVRETGAFTDDLAKKLYQVTGQQEPPDGHIFVRQEYRPVLDVPIALRNSEQPLGMHLFSATFALGDSEAQWMAISLEGDALAALDRIEIPTDIREKISEKLTPGSSLIIGEEAKDSAILPDGADFIVLAKHTPTVAQTHSGKKQATVGKPKTKVGRKWRPSRGYAYNFRGFERPRLFHRWRWRR